MTQQEEIYYTIQKFIGRPGDDRHDEALKLMDYLIDEGMIKMPCALGTVLYRNENSILSEEMKTVEYEVSSVSSNITREGVHFHIGVTRQGRNPSVYETFIVNSAEDLARYFFRSKWAAEKARREMEE